MRTWILAALAALAAGCFGGLKNEVPSPLIYRVNAPALAAGAPIATDLLVIAEGTAPGLDGTGIAGRWPGNRLDYLAGARWAEDVPALVQSALIEALQGTGRARSVQGDLGRFRATHTLVVDVRRFDADYTGGGVPVAQVALSATLGRTSDRRVLAAFTVSASEAATENRQSTVVAALNAAFARVTGELAEKSFTAIAADLASAQAAQNGGGGAAEPRLAARDFEPLAGAPWSGTLTYKDYGTGSEVSIASDLVVTKSRPDGLAWSFEYRYPKEPQANSRDEVAISADGRMLNGERVVERSQPLPGRFSIRKEVQFEGTREFLERNRYDWTR